jgi:hypothetical protein
LNFIDKKILINKIIIKNKITIKNNNQILYYVCCITIKKTVVKQTQPSAVQIWFQTWTFPDLPPNLSFFLKKKASKLSRFYIVECFLTIELNLPSTTETDFHWTIYTKFSSIFVSVTKQQKSILKVFRGVIVFVL